MEVLSGEGDYIMQNRSNQKYSYSPIFFSHLINELVCQNREWNWRGQGKGFAIKKKTEDEN